MKFDDMGQAESPFLGKQDIPGPVNVTIQGYAERSIDRGGDRKEPVWVVKFNEFDKPMILNWTNRTILKSLFGDDSTASIHGKVQLYVDPTVRNPDGQVVGGLRLRPAQLPVVEANQPNPAADPDDKIPW